MNTLRAPEGALTGGTATPSSPSRGRGPRSPGRTASRSLPSLLTSPPAVRAVGTRPDPERTALPSTCPPRRAHALAAASSSSHEPDRHPEQDQEGETGGTIDDGGPQLTVGRRGARPAGPALHDVLARSDYEDGDGDQQGRRGSQLYEPQSSACAAARDRQSSRGSEIRCHSSSMRPARAWKHLGRRRSSPASGIRRNRRRQRFHRHRHVPPPAEPSTAPRPDVGTPQIATQLGTTMKPRPIRVPTSGRPMSWPALYPPLARPARSAGICRPSPRASASWRAAAGRGSNAATGTRPRKVQTNLQTKPLAQAGIGDHTATSRSGESTSVSVCHGIFRHRPIRSPSMAQMYWAI